jgi:hypothetical protein
MSIMCFLRIEKLGRNQPEFFPEALVLVSYLVVLSLTK